MKPRLDPSAVLRPGKAWPTLVCLLGAAGAVVSVLSTLDHLEYVAPLSDGAGLCGAVFASSCTSAHASPSAEVFGVPITLYGLGFYVAAIVLAAWTALRGQPTVAGQPPARWAPVALAALSALSVVYSLYLGSVLFRRGAVCPFCLALYGVNAGLLLASALWTRPAWQHAGASLRSASLAFGVSLAVGGTVLVLGATTYFLARAGRERELRPAVETQGAGNPVLPDRIPAEGPSDARIELVVFADFECPACARLHGAVNEAARKLGPAGPRVRFVNYPLHSDCNPYTVLRAHGAACLAARGGICAARMGVFREYADVRFSSPGRHDRDDLVGTATTLGLPAAEFEACLDAPATGRALAEDVELAHAAGVNATPTYLLNGDKFVGATTAATLERMLREDAR